MNRRVIIDNFQPYENMIKMFNNKYVYYGNCWYSVFLTLANSFGRDTISILNNIIYIYHFDRDRLHTGGYFGLQGIDVKSLDSILSGMGIEVAKKFPGTESLKEEIIHSVSTGNPVGVCIDLYYQPGRTMWYNLRHGGGHMLLVYGYDLDKNIIYTIDDVTGINRYTLTFDELLAAYEGQFEYCNYKIGESELFYEFIIKPDNSECLSGQKPIVNRQISEFANNMLCYKEQILPSLENILCFADVYEDILQGKYIIYTLGAIIYGRMAEQFRLINLRDYGFGSSNIQMQLDSLIAEVIREWNKVRLYTVKALNFKNLELDRKMVLNTIKGIYENERQFYEGLFVLVDKYASNPKVPAY